MNPPKIHIAEDRNIKKQRDRYLADDRSCFIDAFADFEIEL